MIDPIDVELVPPFLSALGVVRAYQEIPDLDTIWKTPYPVITNYRKWIARTDLKAFGGGTITLQQHGLGRISSGYRDEIMEGRKRSPHMFGFAIDTIVGFLFDKAIEYAIEARPYFSRIGLYPDNGFIHTDQANRAWLKKYSGRRYWIKKGGVYQSFDDFDLMIDYARGL